MTNPARSKFLPALPLAALWILLSAFGGPAHEGSALQMEGDHQAALEKYKQAQQADPENKAVDYNMGGAYHGVGEYQEAVKAYERAVNSDDKALAANSIFNRGVSLYRAGEAAERAGSMEQAQKMYSSSAAGYKALLKDHPADNAARHNLELALAKIQQLEDQKQRSRNQNQKDQSGKPEKQENGEKGKDEKSADKKAGEEEKKQEEKSGEKAAQDQQQERQDQDQQEGEGISPQEAKATLDAVNKDEMEIKRALRNRMMPPAHRPEKDW